MSTRLSAHFKALRSQLESTVLPNCGDRSARRVGIYCHKVLTQLQLEMTVLPSLQADAVKELGKLLDQILDPLSRVEGTLGLNGQLLHHLRVAPNLVAAGPHLQRAVQLLSKNPDETARELLVRITDILFRLEEAYHHEIQENLIRQVQADESPEGLTTPEKQVLADYLRRQFPEDGEVEIGRTSLIVGGGSKVTMIIELLNSSRLPANIIMRKDSASGVVGSTVLDEYFLIELMFEAGVTVPEPFLLEKDPSILDGAFMLVSKVAGHNIGDWNDVFEPSREFALDLARALALTHQVPLHKVEGRVTGSDMSAVEKLMADVNEFESLWRNMSESSVILEQAFTLVKNFAHFAEGHRSVVHGDAGCHNMLGHDGRLAALLDWECAVVGNPAQDLAYVYDTIIQMMPWDEFLTAYEAAGGSLPSEREYDIYWLWTKIFKYYYTVISRVFIGGGVSTLLIHSHGAEHLYQQNGYELAKAVKFFIEKYGIKPAES